MVAIPRRDNGSLAALATITAAAWFLLTILGSRPAITPVLCSSTGAWPGATASLDLFLALNPPGRLAADWALMMAAMTPPLLAAPLRHLGGRDFPTRRGPAMLTFLGGYLLVWMTAGAVLQALALTLRIVERPGSPMLALAVAIALLWQASPAKQRCLNRCHDRPRRTAFAFGVTHGASCVGACWALMLLPLILTGGHLPAMAAVALFLFAERLERPAPPRWRLRAPGKALRRALLRVVTPAQAPPPLSALKEPQS